LRFLSFGCSAFSRCRVDLRVGSCDHRITSHPGPSSWLTTLLHAQTIAREDGANLNHGRPATPDLRKASTATHPTRPTPPEGASEPLTSLLPCLRYHARA